MIIEEPERNIHPYLISKVLEMMKEVSAHKQIIVTTHNPEVLKYSLPGDILFIARDKEGFSQISRPYENQQVKIFLQNEMGMDELYTQNLLEL
jgi:predicted ATPase